MLLVIVVVTIVVVMIILQLSFDCFLLQTAIRSYNFCYKNFNLKLLHVFLHEVKLIRQLRCSIQSI